MKKAIIANLGATLILISLFSFKSMNESNLDQTATGDSTSFDFWIGHWDLTWTSNGKPQHGVNIIEKAMNGKVVHESFTAGEGDNAGYKGESFSVFDITDHRWKQTWIDNQGAYLDFTGRIGNGIRYFERTGWNPKGEKVHQRMKFYNIEKDSFTWDWEKSTDGNKWELVWRINYQRQH